MLRGFEWVFHNFRAAFELAKGNERGMEKFDLSLEGFYRSFFALLIAYPTALYLAYVQWQMLEQKFELGPHLFWQSLIFLVLWLVMPGVMIFLCRWLDRRDYFVSFVVVYNWASALGAWFLCFMVLNARTGLFGPLSPHLVLLSQGALLLYEWFIFRTSLRIPSLTAIALVLLEMILAILVNLTLGRFGVVPLEV